MTNEEQLTNALLKTAAYLESYWRVETDRKTKAVLREIVIEARMALNRNAVVENKRLRDRNDPRGNKRFEHLTNEEYDKAVEDYCESCGGQCLW